MPMLAETADEFLLMKEAGRRAEATLLWYAALLKPFTGAYGDREIASFTRREIAKWLLTQTGTPATLYDRDKVIRAFFTWCAETYGIDHPMRGLPVPKLPPPEPKAIDPDDLNRLLEVCGGFRDRAILMVLADTGLRASGLVSLSIDDVDFASHTLRVAEKQARTRQVPFSLGTERVIIEWCRHRPLDAEKLFCTVHGGEMTYWGLRQVIRRLAIRAGFTDERCNLHSLRHFAAREYLRNGGSLPALATILGHKSITTTSNYYAVYTSGELAEVHDIHSPLKSLKKRNNSV
jgi:integrase/recombinase XerD